MITITRQRARRLRAVFRRRVLGIGHRGEIPPLVLHAEGARLRAQHLYQHLAVEYVEPGAPRQLDSVTLPLEALADFEGRDENPVVLESAGPDMVVASWQERGIPRSREYPATPFGTIAPFPDAPRVRRRPDRIPSPGTVLRRRGGPDRRGGDSCRPPQSSSARLRGAGCRD